MRCSPDEKKPPAGAEAELQARKQELRRILAQRARLLTEAERAEAGRAMACVVRRLPPWKAARTVLLFWSLPTEPDTSPLIRLALEESKTVLLPRCVSPEDMEAVPYTRDTELKPGPFGIPFPEGAAFPGSPDLVLVPCVSASPEGVRLGHGAGYYDRYLSAHPGHWICLCLARMVTPDLPAAGHDIRMPWVVTENGILRQPSAAAESPAPEP